MSPPLPPELLQEVLALALVDEPPAKRQQTRIAFGRVCRVWRESVDEWKELEIIGDRQLVKVLAKLDSHPSKIEPELPGARIGALHLELVGYPEVGDVDVVQTAFDRLLSLSSSVKNLSLLLDGRCLMNKDQIYQPEQSWRVEEEVDWFGPLVGPGLSKLSRVVNFKLTTTGEWDAKPWLSVTWLKRILTGWTAVEVLFLEGCKVGFTRTDEAQFMGDAVWSEHSKLRTLQLSGFKNEAAVRPCLANLPSTLTALSLSSSAFLVHVDVARQTHHSLLQANPRLTNFSLAEPPAAAPGLYSISRGGWERLLGQMTDLRWLRLNVCAVANVARALASLERLAELELAQDYVTSTPVFASSEVEDVLRVLPALRRVVLARGIWVRWTGAAVRAVRRETEERGMGLVLGSEGGAYEGSDLEWEDESGEELTASDGEELD